VDAIAVKLIGVFYCCNGSQVMFLTILFYRYPIPAFERLRLVFVIINTINTIWSRSNEFSR